MSIRHYSEQERDADDSIVARPLNAFTVDVEDYFQVSGFERDIARSDWSSFASRVVDDTGVILELLSKHNVRGTFFVLGWVAEHFPDLIKEIDAAGHEVGSHGYWHRLVYEQTADEFRADLSLSQLALERSIGKRARCYRAPSFSVTRQSLWALDVLAAEGFTIDASIFPVRHDRYGIPDAIPSPHAIETPNGSVIEFPGSVTRLGGVNLPIAGGGYFRLAPYLFAERVLNRINRRDGRPFVFYIHPWEVDPHQPRLRAGGVISRWRHYVNLKSTAAKLERLLQSYRFGTISESLLEWAARAEWPQPLVSLLEQNTESCRHPLSLGATDVR